MWIYNEKEIKSIEDLPKNAYGFIYLITNTDIDKSYIGKKNLYFTKKTPLGKKEIAALPDKRSKKYKYVEKESDWLSYTGSCIALNEDIKEGANIEKEIIEVCFSKRELTYKEIKNLFLYEVLESNKFYNESINRMWFKGNID